MNLPGPGPGRPKGSKNKKTRETLDMIDKMISLLDETFDDDVKKMKPAERAKMKVDLLEYKAPKLARTEIKAEVTSGPKKIGVKKPSNDSDPQDE